MLRIPLAALLCVLASCPVLRSQPVFASPVPVPSGIGPGGVAAGDLDQDGDSDLVVAESAGSSLSVWWNDGSGVSGTATTLTATSAPEGVHLADLDGDSLLDIVVRHGFFGGSPVRWRQNLSGGAFASPAILIPQGVLALGVADMDGSGLADLVVTEQLPSSVRIYLNQGGAGFVPGNALPLGPLPVALALGDVDGDQMTDVLVLDGMLAEMRVVLNGGMGQPLAGPLVTLPSSGVAIALGDLDGDGDLDAAVTLVGGGVSLFLGDGAGGFTQIQTLPIAGSSRGAAWADFEGDGYPELVVLDSLMSTSVVFWNREGQLTAQTSPGLPTGARSLVVTDLDGNSSPDLVVTSFQSNTFSLLLNRTPQILVPVPVTVGTTTDLVVSSPSDGGFPCISAFAVFSSPGIPLPQGRHIPLTPDFLFDWSLDPTNPIFLGTFGVLASDGTAIVSLRVPPVPALSGFRFFGAFLVVDPGAPLGIGTISPARPLVIE